MSAERINLGIEDFGRLARRADRVPVVRELLLDHDTPVSAYRKWAGPDPGFLLESVAGGENWGRYSILGARPAGWIRARGDRVQIEWGGRRWSRRRRDPLGVVREWLASIRCAKVEGLPRFHGGAVGTLDFELLRRFEKRPGLPPLPASSRDELSLQLVDELVVFDNLSHTVKLVVCAETAGGRSRAYDRARRRLDAMEERLHQAQVDDPRPIRSAPRWRSETRREAFAARVRQAQECIRAGDIFQVVLSHELRTPFAGDPFDAYRALRCINPSPYMFFLREPHRCVAGSSPEVLVRVVEDRAELRPIAGTRRRGADEAADATRIADLLADPKERAEHVMLLDLGRNDLGRVCRPGSVRTTEQMTIERYSHVLHMVSHVEGRLHPERDAFDALRAAFPAGTVSGAPKSRALQIIDALEKRRRGLYAGAVGYFGFGGAMDTCIALRTLEIAEGEASLGVGAGIVLDSRPEREWEETMEKAGAALAALQMAGRGLVP